MVVAFPYMDNDNFDVFTIVKSGCCTPYMDKDNFDVFTIVKCIFSYGILFIRIIIRIIYKKE